MLKRKKVFIMFALAALLFALFVPVRLTVDVDGKVYGKDKIHRSRITVCTQSALGIKKRVYPGKNGVRVYQYKGVDVVHASFMYLSAQKRIATVPVRKIDARYDAAVYPGDKFNAMDLKCETVYADGKRTGTKVISVADPPKYFLNMAEDLTVVTRDGTVSVPVEPVKLVSVEAELDREIYQYDTPDFKSIKFTYADGTEHVIGKDAAAFSVDINKPLKKLGAQKMCFSYKGLPYVVYLTTKKNTNVTNAVRANKNEMKSAEYLYVSDTIYVAVNEVSDSRGFYYLSHVVVNDPSQVVSAMSYDTWGGKREKPSSAAERLDMVIAANGSYFSYDTNTPRCADVFIKHGKVYSDKYTDEESGTETTTDGKELCLLKDGTLWTPKAGLTAGDLLEKGVTDVWGAGDPLLIQDGKLYPTHHDWVNGKYPRTGIGMVKPCEYYLLTAGSGGYKGGLTFDDVQEIFKDLNCSYARTLDGGGSSTLVFNDGDGVEVVNNPAGKAERPVPDFIGFSN